MLSGRQRYEQRRTRRRGSNRKYAGHHARLRAELAPYVAAGLALCARCQEPIAAGEPWDLGHDDVYPELHSGPEHTHCNRGAPHRNVTSRKW